LSSGFNSVEVATHAQCAVAATIATTTCYFGLNKKVSTFTSQKTLLMVDTYQVNKEHSREEEN